MTALSTVPVPAGGLAGVATVLVAVVTAGCSAGGPAAAPVPSTVASAPAAPAAPVVVTPAVPLPCTATSGLALPTGWPDGVPLPDGLVITRTERRSGDRLIVSGFVPGDFHRVVEFFNTRLPAAGLPQRNGQIDPFDAESDFTGTALQGRWSVGLSIACRDAADLTVLVLPPGPPLPPVPELPAPRPPG